MKALVLAIAHDAFDDPNIWIEPLQKSISGHRADRRRIIRFRRSGKVNMAN